MFRGLINDATSAAGSLIAKYLARASVVVPFFVALGFATAAVTLTLIERFGPIAASWIVAAGFTVIGLVATVAVTVKEQEDEIAEQHAEQADTADMATDAAAQAAAQMPLALLGALLSTPLGPSTVAGGAKLVARNIPLIVLVVLIAVLFWPTEPATAQETEAEAADVEEADEAHADGRPNGAEPQRSSTGYHHEAAA